MRFENEQGFTLLEVLVAGVLLAIGLLGIAGMMTSSIRGNDFGKRLTTAEFLAQQRLEQLRNLAYGDAKKLAYDSLGNPPIVVCGDADPDTDPDNIELDDDADDGPSEQEGYQLEDYGMVKDLQDPTVVFPAYRRDTLVEAAGACNNPPTDKTATVTVVVRWKGVTGTHSVKLMSMLAL